MKRLQLTVHDVSPAHEETLRKIHAVLLELGVVRYSMLVVPDYHGKWLLDGFPEFCRWLQELDENGVEIVLHGFVHVAGSSPMGISDRIRSMLFTRDEGEFLGLNEKEAEELLRDGCAVLKRTLDIEVSGFAAPAWLYSRGTTAALAKTGFIFAENRWRIWAPQTGRTLLRIPAVNYAGGGAVKRSLAAFWVMISGVFLRGSRTVRFAVHPCDFEDSVRKGAVIRHLKKLLRRRKTISFTDLLPAPECRGDQ
ncbi:MAG: polysaccharide deacetylase family protein [Candidatus Fermentibacteria bacterium]